MAAELVDLEIHPEPIPDGGDESHSQILEDNEEQPEEFTLVNYFRHSNKFLDKSFWENSFKGLFIIWFSVPAKRKIKKYCKYALFIFFFINFLYPIIVFLIEREHPAYNIVCSCISLVGLLYELCNTIIFSYIMPWCESRKARKIRPTDPPIPREAFEDREDIHMAEIENNSIKDKLDTKKEPKDAVIEFIRDTL